MLYPFRMYSISLFFFIFGCAGTAVLAYSSEQLPKEFEKTTEVLPFSKYGLSSMEEFQKAESEIHQLEKFKRAGLSDVEIKLYEQSEAGTIDEKKMESTVLKHKLDIIYEKIRKMEEENENLKEEASTSHDILKPSQKSLTYPDGHPMNSIKEMEENLFSHLKTDEIPSLSKRHKMLRRFERRKERILSQEHPKPHLETNRAPRPGSKWDMKEAPKEMDRNIPNIQSRTERQPRPVPFNRLAMYTIKDNKIVRVEPQEEPAENRMVEPADAEEELLEGTKMAVEDIRKIDEYKDYKPGIPSKVLILKNISPSVTEEQLKLLFNQFILGNGGPVDVQMLQDRGKTSAFVYFQNEDTAIQALEEANGTVVAGRPIVAYFKSNR